MLSLAELERRFLAALDPGAAGAADPSLLALVRSGGALGAAERVGIYAAMYRARLVDVLGEDFPRVAALAGPEAFQALACRYLGRHPSAHPSVRHVGRHFPRFLAGEAGADAAGGAAYLADLARLEWARVEAFDAVDAEPVRLADLAGLDPADGPGLRFRPIPACTVVESAWPIHEIWAAAAGGEPAGGWPRAATAVRVWREGFEVSHAAMAAAEQRAFALVQAGEPFARLCAALGEALDAEAAAREVGGLLMRWLEDGLLVLDGRSPGAA